ncbi:serine/threonine-protein kinase [Streptomyces sp. I05A-00742]|uniref:serine/threonine-protein kinase n=1 Tax=Streptomyces sp. I05A-00742 TaxID=2732853 RepID=UPI0014883022|nr:serine/threonine-protein kinase [Streptomyces sp. I05A-00742]
MRPLLEEDPRAVGPYRLLGVLGAGGMGRVYVGRNAGGRTVAVKVVHPRLALDEEFRSRFRREVETARRVGGAWTAPVLDADPDAPVPWVVTGYVAGPSLGQAVADVGALPERAVRVVGAGLAEALAAVHALGLVHRDVKPSNVLLPLDGPRLIDFGIARAMDGSSSLTATGMVVGSSGYMAPEQVLGDPLTGAADVFSLGAVLAFAAGGAPPYPGEHHASVNYRVVHGDPELGPGLTGELRELVAACLAKEPAARPAPAELARRIAGGRAAGALVGPGWLPAPLVEQVSRRAVELLGLEGGGSEPAGAFGPAVAYAPTEWGGGPSPAGNGYGADGALYGGVPSDGTGGPRTAAATYDGLPGGPYTDRGPYGDRGAAPSGPVPSARRGRRAALVALPAAGVVVAVLAVLLGLGVWPFGGDDGGGSGTRGTVPKTFVGTWTGGVVQGDGTANGTMKTVITQGRTGEYVVRNTYDVLNVFQCRSKARLRSATATKITLVEESDGPQHALCTGARATLVYTRGSDGRLSYRSDDRQGGSPTATLTRAGG